MEDTSAHLRLFSGPLSMFGAKTQIAALEMGLDFELVMVPFETAYEPKHPEVVRVNPTTSPSTWHRSSATAWACQ